jgi:hypothetical protein
MGQFVGLDVSVEETSICVMDVGGTVLHESKVKSTPAAISRALHRHAREAERMSSWISRSVAEIVDPEQTVGRSAKPLLIGMRRLQMTDYRVSFINEIARNDRVFHPVQRSIVIRSAHSRARAIEAAKECFARLEGIRDWKLHASRIEVEPVDPEDG